MNEAFIAKLTEAIGAQRVGQALEGLSQAASVSVRLNPSKAEGVRLPILDGAAKVPWSEYGFLLKERPVFTLHPLFHSGVYYVQDSSAMFVGEACRRAFAHLDADGRPVRVLDLCAAPGGKTTDLAASLRAAFGGNFILVANEVMRKRASVLSDNVGRWGDPNVIVTGADPKAFARLESFFDLILADVPCSGEGMFRKDEEALAQWSNENVALCASRQKRIVADVWPALKQGGLFVYSTCTFNRDENDAVARWICEGLGAENLGVPCDFDGLIQTEEGCSLVPGFVPGEGQYCAVLKKSGGSQALQSSPSETRPDPAWNRVQDYFKVPVSVSRKDGKLLALPASISADAGTVTAFLPTLVSGCGVGQFKGEELVPDEDLALCTELQKGIFQTAEVDKQTALAFLHKDAVLLPDSPRGIVMLLYKGVPLGFVKNLGNRTNNLHPQSRRIRMEIQ